jgi:hypothetical protein
VPGCVNAAHAVANRNVLSITKWITKSKATHPTLVRIKFPSQAD